MESLAKISHRHYPLHLSLHRRPSFSKSIISTTRTSLSRKKLILRASSIHRFPDPQNHHNKPLFETLKPLSSILKTTCIVIAATSLFFARFNKPSVAAPNAEPTFESIDEKQKKSTEDHLDSHRDDVESLRSIMEVKIKDRKLQEAISIIDRLIQIEPSEKQWPLLKAHLRSYSGEVELAKLGFEDILSEDPLFVEAYHGLVMTASQSEPGELDVVLKRIENAMDKCKIENKKEDLRDFKLLVAQVRVMEGSYMDALKLYQELEKEEPRDFRPYLCQGIIYTLLGKKEEADKLFNKYRRLVPKEHPYAQYFEENMMATKGFVQMMEKQKMGSKS